MTAAVVIPPPPGSSHRHVVVDSKGRPVGARCFYPRPDGGVWVVTVAPRVCTVHARPGGWDDRAEAEAATVAAGMVAHPALHCFAGLRINTPCQCLGVAA